MEEFYFYHIKNLFFPTLFMLEKHVLKKSNFQGRAAYGGLVNYANAD
jgi:hypothetical protein